MLHICASESGQHWFRLWFGDKSHYLNHCWDMLIVPLGTNFSEILIEIHTFSLKKMLLKMSSGKWRPFCLDLNVLKENLQLCVTLKMNHSLLKREHHNSGRNNYDLNANKWSLFKLALPSSTQKHTVVINDWRESCIADQWGQSVDKLRLQPLLFTQACFYVRFPTNIQIPMANVLSSTNLVPSGNFIHVRKR